MAKPRSQDFLRGTDEHQTRVINTAGLIVLAIVAVALFAALWVYPRVNEPEGITVGIDVPYVGPGVSVGTKVLLHGAEVGEVTSLEKDGPGLVAMELRLQPDQTRGLTDTFELDFRPQNYFGVSAVNFIPRSGGTALADGDDFAKTPSGDFTMSTMLEKGSVALEGTLTDSLIDSLNKAIDYTDGLTPLIESGIIIADRVAATQKALPTELMAYMNDSLEVLPAFSTEAINALETIYYSDYNRRPDGSVGVDDEFMDASGKGLDLAANSLFGKAGNLLKSHGAELTPGTYLIKSLVDVLPHMLDGGAAQAKISALIDRYNAAFSGPDGDKTLNLRLAVDAQIPALGAPR